MQNKYHFELMVFQNGRGAQLKPFLNYCQNEKIDFCDVEERLNAKRKESLSDLSTSTDTFSNLMTKS